MRISIIIPVYNVEMYLCKCLDSILSQNRKDIELILVDDGSKDASPTICDEYAVRFENVFVFHIENQGASHARNVGIEHAQGDLICFVDSDDWVSEDYLEILTKNYVEDIVFFGVQKVYEDGCISSQIHKQVSAIGKDKVEKVLLNMKYSHTVDTFGWTVNKFFRKSIIDEYQIRFVEGIDFREDEIFTMDYCKHINSIRVIDKPLYNYRIRKDGLTGIGIRNCDNLLLADNMERNLPYYHNIEFLNKEKERIADYHIQYFWKKYRFWNLYSSIAEVHSFFKRKSEYKKYASDQQFVRLCSHSCFVSAVLVLVHQIIGYIYYRM